MSSLPKQVLMSPPESPSLSLNDADGSMGGSQLNSSTSPAVAVGAELTCQVDLRCCICDGLLLENLDFRPWIHP